MGLALGFSQQEKEIPMMGERISPKVFTGASYDAMTVNNNFIFFFIFIHLVYTITSHDPRAQLFLSFRKTYLQHWRTTYGAKQRLLI